MEDQVTHLKEPGLKAVNIKLEEAGRTRVESSEHSLVYGQAGMDTKALHTFYIIELC